MKATSLILAFILSTSLAKAQNAPQVSYFPLQNVKLLDSPFLQAQQTDFHYILALPTVKIPDLTDISADIIFLPCP